MNFFNNNTCGNGTGIGGCDCCTLILLLLLLQSICGGNGCGIDCCTLILILLLCGCNGNNSHC